MSNLDELRTLLTEAQTRIARRSDAEPEMGPHYFRLIGQEQGIKIAISYLDAMRAKS